MSLALLCSGQGQQHAAMFDVTGTAPEAAPLFAHAAGLLGADPRLVAADPEARTANRAGQILCTLQTLAAFAVIGTWPRDVLVAGYSVGELAAWSISGLIEPCALLDLAARRADLMDRASRPGDGMLFVRGLTRGVVEGLCEGRDAAIAIVNPDRAFVIGGGSDALDVVAREAERAGASRTQRLSIRVASHTDRLSPAVTAFNSTLAALPPKRLPRGTRLFSGIDAVQVQDWAAGGAKLAAQIAKPVQWDACLEALAEAGATGALELGPGHALADMLANTRPALAVRSLDQFRTVQGVRDWLARLPA